MASNIAPQNQALATQDESALSQATNAGLTQVNANNARSLAQSGVQSPVPNLGPFTPNRRVVRTVNFGHTINWDCKINGAPAPFDTWFPAVDLRHQLFEVQAGSITVGPGEYKYPKGFGSDNISLTFLDNDQGVLERWFEDWVKDDNNADPVNSPSIFRNKGTPGAVANIFGNTGVQNAGGTVATLTESARLFMYAHMDNTRKAVFFRSLYLIPEGPLGITRNSEMGFTMLNMSFTVVQYSRNDTP